MAKSKDEKGDPIFSRSPQQASRIFGYDQSQLSSSGGPSSWTSSPRPRFLFLVRFVRGAGQGSAKWQNGMTFAVKRVDRPKITPQVSELKQYNKKRLIQTGVKYSPVSLEFHDTVDSIVNQMWVEYAQYHYGDFNRKEGTDWNYDVTTAEFLNNGSGFGHTLPKSSGQSTQPQGLNSHFFFERLECYQLFGGNFVQYDLIHPFITDYSPDEMSYEEGSGAHSIRMSLEYESVIYTNNEQPRPIAENDFLNPLFGRNGSLEGDVYEPPTAPVPTKTGFGSGVDTVNRVLNVASNLFGVGNKNGNRLGIPPTVGTVLGAFGTFNFETYVRNVANPVTEPLSAILGATASLSGGPAASTATQGISAPVYDRSFALAEKQAASGFSANPGMAAANAFSANTGSSVLAAFNSGRPESSQVGVRTGGASPLDPSNFS